MDKKPYTRKEHLAEKREIQTLLDLVRREIKREIQLKAHGRRYRRIVLVGRAMDGREVILEQEFVSGMGYINMNWFGSGKLHYLHMQYDTRSGRISDSAKFDKKGLQRGLGHIQFDLFVDKDTDNAMKRVGGLLNGTYFSTIAMS